MSRHAIDTIPWSNFERPDGALHHPKTTSGLCLACDVSSPCLYGFGVSSYSNINNHRNESAQKVIAKSVRHFRLQNERDILLRFQRRTSAIRPLIEELKDTNSPPTLILKYLDDDVLNASNKQRLTHSEVVFVARKMLEALAVLHDEGFVHTGVISRSLHLCC